MRRRVFLLLTCLALAGCWSHPRPPAGRWIGNYESPSVMVDARLEIAPNGNVRVSAPDALDVGSPTDEERTTFRARLAAELAEEWDQVVPRTMDFDGQVFRKPGGIAPQMEWDAKKQEMKLVFYFGMQRSIRIVMHPVSDFSDDPWADPGADHQS